MPVTTLASATSAAQSVRVLAAAMTRLRKNR
jgi:hypothetical protein